MNTVEASASGRNSPTKEIAASASTWLVRRRAGLSREDEHQFQSWLSADPRHTDALAEMEAAWSAVSFPGRSGQSHLASRLLTARTRRRRVYVLGGASLAAAAALVIAFALSGPKPAPHVGPATVVVRPDRQVLSDGSTVELNAGAQIVVAFSPEARRVQLVRGEALFDVAKNATRPFLVTASGVEVRAIGTAFAVRNGTDQIDVLVTQGRVAVERPALAPKAGAERSATPVFLDAGERVVVPTEHVSTATLEVQTRNPAEIAAALAWRGHRIEFSRTPLTEAVELFNRKNRLQLSVGDSSAAALRISGIFWADDPEGFFRLLEQGFDLRTELSGDRLILRSPRQ